MATSLNGESGTHSHMAESVPSEAVINLATKSHGDSAHIFRFFELPRELRDKIYEQPVLMEHWHIFSLMLNHHDRYTQGEKLSTSLLLVNHQFRDEYTERCWDQPTLCLRDYLDFSDNIGVLNLLDELRSWALSICIVDSSAHLTAPRRLEPYLGNCARWYHDLRAVNIILYLNYQSDVEDCAPYVFDHMQSTIADIASFSKVAKLEIYMTKPARRHKRASWSRRLLARWRRDEPAATILLRLAPASEGSEWEDFEGFDLEVDCSTYSSLPSSSSCSDSWPDDKDDAGDDQRNEIDDDQNGDDGDGEKLCLEEELLDQKGYGSAEESDHDVGDGINSVGIDSEEDAGRVGGDEHLYSNHANNTSSHLDLFKSPGGIPDSIYGQTGTLQNRNSTLCAFQKIMNGVNTDDHDDDEDHNLYLRWYRAHDTEALIVDTTAQTLTSRPPPQDYTRELGLLRIIYLELLAILVFVLVCGALDMILSSR